MLESVHSVVFDMDSGVGGSQKAAMMISDLVIATTVTGHLALFGVRGALETLTCLSQTRDQASSCNHITRFFMLHEGW